MEPQAAKRLFKHSTTKKNSMVNLAYKEGLKSLAVSNQPKDVEKGMRIFLR